MSVVAIAVYALFVGLDPAVLRAALMAALAAFAVCFGRQSVALVSLSAAALFMTIADPLTLWDVGFQLSTGATLGLVLIGAPVQSLLGAAAGAMGDRWAGVRRLLNDTLVTTLAAQVFTLPLILFYFGRLSLIAPLANVLILPAQPALMGTGALATLVGLVWQPAGQAVAAVAWLFLTYTVRVVEALARLSFASVAVDTLSPVALWACFGATAGIIWLVKARASNPAQFGSRLLRHLTTKVAVTTLLLLAVLTWAAAYSMPDGRLHVRFLDVGQGDAALITTPAGNQLVIDGGPSPAALLSQLGRAMPFWNRRIEFVSLSHADSDHLTGLPSLVERYDVGTVLDAALSDTSPLFTQWEQSLTDRGIPTQRAVAGQRVDLDSGAYVEVLFPEEIESGVGRREASTPRRQSCAWYMGRPVSCLPATWTPTAKQRSSPRVETWTARY